MSLSTSFTAWLHSLAQLPWASWLGALWLAYALALAVWIVLQKRSPVATLAWIMSLSLMPLVGLAVYAWFGPRRIQRQRLRRWHQRASVLSQREWQALLAQRAEPPVWAVQHARLIERSCGLPMSACHSVQLLGSGAAALDALLQAIAQARRHIHLEYYIFAPDHTGQTVLRALAERARQGVAVRLLVDAVGSFTLHRRRCPALRELLDAGGQMALFHPARLDRFRPLVNLRTHRKMVICDGQIGLLGGINITDAENERQSGPAAWRDTHLRLHGAAVRWLQYLFLQDWAYASGHTLPGDMLPPEGSDEEGDEESALADVPVQIAASGPDNDGEAIHRAVIDAIGLARHRIWLATPYFVPTEETLAALTNAALRGVQIKLMTTACSDSRLVAAAASSYYDELLRAGALIFEYGPPMLHAKTLLVDGHYAMIGSANFDNRSFRLNFEVAAVILSAAFNAELAALFERDLSRCRRITERRRLPWRQRLLEAVARLFSRLL
ncbi:MAG: cardiolipin synthase [Ottowia sp.]